MDARTAMTRALDAVFLSEERDSDGARRTARLLIEALWAEGFDVVSDGTGATKVAAQIAPLVHEGRPAKLRLVRADA